MLLSRSCIWREGEREGCGIFGGASTCGEAVVPPFPRGAHVKFIVVQRAVPEGPGRGGDCRTMRDLWTRGL